MGCGSSSTAGEQRAKEDHLAYRSSSRRRTSISMIPSAHESDADSMHHRSDRSSESDGEHTEEGDTVLSIRKKLLVFKARVRHGINDDPNQFEDTARVHVSKRSMTVIRNYVDDHIKASLEAEILGDVGNKYRKKLSGSQTFTNSMGMASTSTLATPLGLSAISELEGFITSHETAGLSQEEEAHVEAPVEPTESPPLLAGIDAPDASGADDLSVNSEAGSSAVEASSPISAQKSQFSSPTKLSSHFQLPPMSLRYELDLEAMQTASENEMEIDTPVGNFLKYLRKYESGGSPKRKISTGRSRSGRSRSPSGSAALTPDLSRSAQALDISISPRKANEEQQEDSSFPLFSGPTGTTVLPMKINYRGLASIQHNSPICGDYVTQEMEQRRPHLNLRWVVRGEFVTPEFDKLCALGMTALLERDDGEV